MELEKPDYLGSIEKGRLDGRRCCVVHRRYNTCVDEEMFVQVDVLARLVEGDNIKFRVAPTSGRGIVSVVASCLHVLPSRAEAKRMLQQAEAERDARALVSNITRPTMVGRRRERLARTWGSLSDNLKKQIAPDFDGVAPSKAPSDSIPRLARCVAEAAFGVELDR